MHRLHVLGRVEQRRQAPEVLLDLGTLAADLDQLGAGGAVEDHALVGGDHLRQPGVVAVPGDVVRYGFGRGACTRTHTHLAEISVRDSFYPARARTPLPHLLNDLDFRVGHSSPRLDLSIRGRPKSHSHLICRLTPAKREGRRRGLRIPWLCCGGRCAPRASTECAYRRLTRAGAVFARREGRPVVISFGSAAGELAACVSAAGMADSSQLTKLELCGPRARLAELVRQATAASVASGGVLHEGGAWWCGAAGQGYFGAERVIEPERVIVLCEPAVGRRLRDLLGAWAARTPGLVVRDRSELWSAITDPRRRDFDVLARLGVLGSSRDPHQVPPFHYAPLARWRPCGCCSQSTARSCW